MVASRFRSIGVPGTLGWLFCVALLLGCQRWAAEGPDRLPTAQAVSRETSAESAAPGAAAGGAAADSPADSARDGSDRIVHGTLFAALAADHGWALTPPDAAARRARWRHAALSEALAQPGDHRPLLERALRDPEGTTAAVGAAELTAPAGAVVAANAAAALALLGSAAGVEHLAAAVRSDQLPLALRCAAAEALARLPTEIAVAPLRELIDHHEPGAGRSYYEELHGELIRGLARHAAACEEPRLIAALAAPAGAVRLEALQAWADPPAGETNLGDGGAPGDAGGPNLPSEVENLCSDPDPRVRAAALAVLARHRHLGAEARLAAGLNDGELSVRLAAADALGELGTAAAVEMLDALAGDEATLIRVAAVRALVRAGQHERALAAASDASWRVRAAATEALTDQPDRNRAAAARRLLDDGSATVQLRAVEAIAPWPLRLAGPLLLEAMASRAYATRQAAARELAARWPPAAEFPLDAPAERRAAAIEDLSARFRAEVGFVDAAVVAEAARPTPAVVTPELLATVEALLTKLDTSNTDGTNGQSRRREALAALADLGPPLADALEHLARVRQRPIPADVYRDVLPTLSPTFAALDRLDSGEAAQRRRGAGALASLAEEGPLGWLAAARLAERMTAEPDPLVWRDALAAVAGDPGEPAVRLAYTAIGHADAEVRRRACELLAAHGEPGHAVVLLPALDDPSPAVVEAAVAALGSCGPLDDTAPLLALLRDAHEGLALEVARTLLRLEDPKAPDVLARLAYSGDPATRRQAAELMGEYPDPGFTATLIALLDDRTAVRAAALASLPRVVGRDVAEPTSRGAAGTAERVEQWRRWHAAP